MMDCEKGSIGLRRSSLLQATGNSQQARGVGGKALDQVNKAQKLL